MTDEHANPPEVAGYPARLEIDYPENGLSRGLPLIKWLLAIPHYIVLALLSMIQLLLLLVAFFAILFTRRYPRAIFDFVVGVSRWSLRVNAYAVLLTTDRYPPFRLGP